MSSTHISAIILAGGQGSRVGQRDKGLLQWNSRPLIDWVIDAVRPQVDDIVISANRHLDQYQARGFPVITDQSTDFAGPLAGIASCIAHAKGELVLTVPCDMPLLPADLVARLRAALEHGNAVVATAEDGIHTQYLVSLYRNRALQTLPDAFAEGMRAVRHYLARLDAIKVDFSDEARCFGNINELQEGER